VAAYPEITRLVIRDKPNSLVHIFLTSVSKSCNMWAFEFGMKFKPFNVAI